MKIILNDDHMLLCNMRMLSIDGVCDEGKRKLGLLSFVPLPCNGKKG